MRQRLKRLASLLSATLMLVSLYAHAGWMPINRDDDPMARMFVTYMDPQSMQRKGEHVTVRVLMNYRERTEEGIASAVGVNEFDCLNDRVRTRSSVSYGELDGKGRVIREFKSVGAWTRVTEGTVNEALLESACDFYPQWWSE